jgi:hypothetical protein
MMESAASNASTDHNRVLQRAFVESCDTASFFRTTTVAQQATTLKPFLLSPTLIA